MLFEQTQKMDEILEEIENNSTDTRERLFLFTAFFKVQTSPNSIFSFGQIPTVFLFLVVSCALLAGKSSDYLNLY